MFDTHIYICIQKILHKLPIVCRARSGSPQLLFENQCIIIVKILTELTLLPVLVLYELYESE